MSDSYRRTGTPEGACRRCGAEVLWAWTAKGRRMPLDPAVYPADDERATVATYTDHLKRLRVRTLDSDNPRPAPFERRGIPHFATCPPLVAERERAASLRAAKEAAPNFRDPEELTEARRAAEHHHEPAVARDELAERRARRGTR